MTAETITSPQERVEKLRAWGRAMIGKGAIFTASSGGVFNGHDFLVTADALEHALSEPTRLAAARAEGFREGQKDAADAIRRVNMTGAIAKLWEEAINELADDVEAGILP